MSGRLFKKAPPEFVRSPSAPILPDQSMFNFKLGTHSEFNVVAVFEGLFDSTGPETFQGFLLLSQMRAFVQSGINIGMNLARVLKNSLRNPLLPLALREDITYTLKFISKKQTVGKVYSFPRVTKEDLFGLLAMGEDPVSLTLILWLISTNLESSPMKTPQKPLAKKVDRGRELLEAIFDAGLSMSSINGAISPEVASLDQLFEMAMEQCLVPSPNVALRFDETRTEKSIEQRLKPDENIVLSFDKKQMEKNNVTPTCYNCTPEANLCLALSFIDSIHQVKGDTILQTVKRVCSTSCGYFEIQLLMNYVSSCLRFVLHKKRTLVLEDEVLSIIMQDMEILECLIKKTGEQIP